MLQIYTDINGNILVDANGCILSNMNITIDDSTTNIKQYKPYIFINGKFIQVKEFIADKNKIFNKNKIFIS